MSDWLHITHAETGNTAQIPDEPGVREAYEARGWTVGDLPDPDAGHFVPPKAVERNEEDGWVTLYHPATGASHSFPSHPEAVQGAYEAGWQATEPKPAAAPEPDPVPDPDPKPSKRKTEPATPATNEGE